MTTIYDDAERTRLVRESRDLYRSIWPAMEVGGVRDTHACLFHAVALQGLLYRDHGVRAMLQAGSCQWPMLTPEEDDGVSPTHFSYEWEGLRDERTSFFFRSGVLPELHVWLALTPRDERNPPGLIQQDTIIDPTTGTWPERARFGGYAWSTPKPPEFLWHTAKELDSLIEEKFVLGINYRAEMEACVVADKLASREIYPKCARALRFAPRKD